MVIPGYFLEESWSMKTLVISKRYEILWRSKDSETCQIFIWQLMKYTLRPFPLGEDTLAKCYSCIAWKHNYGWKHNYSRSISVNWNKLIIWNVFMLSSSYIVWLYLCLRLKCIHQFHDISICIGWSIDFSKFTKMLYD